MTRDDFGQYVKSEYERILRFVRTRVPNRADAEELVQSTLLRLFEVCDTIDVHRPNGFVFRALRNNIIDFYRHRKRRPGPSSLPEQVISPESSSLFGTDLGQMMQQGREVVQEALEALTPRERRALQVCWQTIGDRAEALTLLGLAGKEKNKTFKGYDGPVHLAKKKLGLALSPHEELLGNLGLQRVWELVSEALAEPASEVS